MSVGRPPMTISQGPSTFSMTVEPGLAVPASNSARLAWIALSLSSRSPRFSVNVYAPLVQHLCRRSPDLPGRRPCDRPARHEHDVVHDQAADVDDTTSNRVGQFGRRHRAAGLGDHHRAIGALSTGRPEGNDTPPADAGKVGNAPLEILRVIL